MLVHQHFAASLRAVHPLIQHSCADVQISVAVASWAMFAQPWNIRESARSATVAMIMCKRSDHTSSAKYQNLVRTERGERCGVVFVRLNCSMLEALRSTIALSACMPETDECAFPRGNQRLTEPSPLYCIVRRQHGR